MGLRKARMIYREPEVNLKVLVGHQRRVYGEERHEEVSRETACLREPQSTPGDLQVGKGGT